MKEERLVNGVTPVSYVSPVIKVVSSRAGRALCISTFPVTGKNEDYDSESSLEREDGQW